MSDDPGISEGSEDSEDEARILVLPLMSPLPSPDGVPVREGDVRLMLRWVVDSDGERHLVAPAFSTVALLVERMGDAQPWAAIPALALTDALEGSGAEAVLLDPVVAHG
jgi:hypothetical protein